MVLSGISHKRNRFLLPVPMTDFRNFLRRNRFLPAVGMTACSVRVKGRKRAAEPSSSSPLPKRKRHSDRNEVERGISFFYCPSKLFRGVKNPEGYSFYLFLFQVLTFFTAFLKLVLINFSPDVKLTNRKKSGTNSRRNQAKQK